MLSEQSLDGGTLRPFSTLIFDRNGAMNDSVWVFFKVSTILCGFTAIVKLILAFHRAPGNSSHRLSWRNW